MTQEIWKPIKGYATNVVNVSQCCNGKNKTHNNLKWEFIIK